MWVLFVVGSLEAELATEPGLGHGMALAHNVKNGPGIADTHVGATDTHRDESAVLRLDGVVVRAVLSLCRQ